jgi:hypothetical protein
LKRSGNVSRKWRKVDGREALKKLLHLRILFSWLKTSILFFIVTIFVVGKIVKWKKKLHDMKSHKKEEVPVVYTPDQQPAVTKAAVPVAKRRFSY